MSVLWVALRLLDVRTAYSTSSCKDHEKRERERVCQKSPVLSVLILVCAFLDEE